MKVRLAFAAAVLALGVSAFTPIHTAAARLSGTLACHFSPTTRVEIKFGPETSFPGVRDAARHCVDVLGGHPGRVRIDS